MKIEPKDALLMIALLEGEPMQGLSTFMLITKDAEGKERYLLFGCKPNFAESVNKAFKRMTALRPPGFPQPGPTGTEVEAPQGVTQIHERRTAEQVKEDFPGLTAEEPGPTDFLPCPKCGGEVGHLPNCPEGICKIGEEIR
jgi:hypothetical protein